MAFTWFDKFTDACAALNDEDRLQMYTAIAAYGAEGTVLDLPYPLNAMFALIVEDIDYSKNMRENGRKGGRPKRKAEPPIENAADSEETPLSDSGKPPFPENENPPFRETETPLSDSGKPPFPENENPIQYSTKQYSTVQNNKDKGGASRPFTPPTRSEVEAFKAEKGIPLDVDAFIDFYESNGWRVGKNRMRDWKAAARRAAREWAVEAPPGKHAAEFEELAGAF